MSPGHTFHAMGTCWWIGCDTPHLLGGAEALVHTIEARLSRFLPDSDLSRLNRLRQVISPTLAAVTRRALSIGHDTDGAFDPTLGARLAALGYDRSFELLAPLDGAPRAVRAADPIAYEAHAMRVVVEGDHVALEGPGALDLGGIAKGWTVDRVLEHLLAHGATSALVDGGGDLRGAGGSWPIGVGDDLVVSTSAGAIATSSTRSRRWRDPAGDVRHHILDPRTGLPSEGAFDTSTVIAPDASTADALATALLATPGARLGPLLGRLPDLQAHALVRSSDGHWWMTEGIPLAAGAPRYVVSL